MSSIEEIHGFQFNGKVYPTRAEAERAERLALAGKRMESDIAELSKKLAELMLVNWPIIGGAIPADLERCAKGICEDMFPIYGDRGDRTDEFFRALDRAADDYEAYSLAASPAKEGE